MVSFNCSVCGKNFKEKLAMQIHERRHAVQKPETHWYGDVKLPVKYPCPICGKTFATKNYLNEHYRTHADGKPLAKFIITLGHWMIWVELMCLRRLKLYCVVSHCGQWAGLQWQCLLLSAHLSSHCTTACYLPWRAGAGIANLSWGTCSAGLLYVIQVWPYKLQR